MCSFASRLFKGAELHYGTSLWAIKHFSIYLYGTKFTVITDHKALHWLMTINDPTGRLARWVIYIQAYTFDIIHRPGKKKANVDLLSRPVLLAYEANAVDNLENVEVEDSQEKTLDPWDNEYFLYFMIYKKHKNGSSKTQVKRVEKQAQHFKLVDDRLFYRKDTDDDFYALDFPQTIIKKFNCNGCTHNWSFSSTNHI